MPTAAGVEGDIELRLGVAGNEVRRISVHSTRPLAACAVLHGRPVAESLRLLPTLFSVCGTAQAYAGLSACEDALAMAPEPAQHAARRLLLLAEVAQEHCWRVSVDWPKLVGKNPDVAALAALRKPLAELPAFLYPDGDGLRPGGGRLVVDGATLADALEAFAGQVGASILAGWRGVADVGGLCRWAAEGETPAARFLHRVELTEGRVARYQILAPTEWNFHPEGPLVEGLRGAAAGDGIAWKAAMLVGALDPCVGAEVIVEEDGGA